MIITVRSYVTFRRVFVTSMSVNANARRNMGPLPKLDSNLLLYFTTQIFKKGEWQPKLTHLRGLEESCMLFGLFGKVARRERLKKKGKVFFRFRAQWIFSQSFAGYENLQE